MDNKIFTSLCSTFLLYGPLVKFNTYISSCPLNIRLGFVPVRLDIPPTFAAYAMLRENALLMFVNSNSSSFVNLE